MKNKTLLVVLLLLVGAGAWFGYKHSLTARPLQTTQTPQAQPIALATSGADLARVTHAELLELAERMPAPSVLQPSVGLKEGGQNAIDIEALDAAKATPPPDVPLPNQLVIGFIGNVIGETDPCG